MNKRERGSIEIVTITLLAALIIVLAIPVFTGPGQKDLRVPESTKAGLKTAVIVAPTATP